jgi:hypothetical protein
VGTRNTHLSIPEVAESQLLKGLLQLLLIKLAVSVLVRQPVQLMSPSNVNSVTFEPAVFSLKWRAQKIGQN